MKKQISVVLMLLMCLSIGYAAPNFYVVASEVDEDKIRDGDAFRLTITFETSGTLDEGSTYTLVNTSTDSFSLSSGGNVVKLSPTEGKFKEVIKLKYLGTGQRFAFNIIDDASGNVITSDSITINEVEKDDGDSSPSTPVDTTTMEPLLTLVGRPFAETFITSKRYAIEFEIKNNSMLYARKVEAKLIAGDDALPFDVDRSTLIDTVDDIRYNNSGTFNFDLKLDPAVATKVYNVKLQLIYQNIHGNSFTKEIPVRIKVDNVNLLPLVSIIQTELAGGSLVADKETALNLTLSNAGSLNAKKIEVQLKGFAADGIRLSGDFDTKHIPEMAQMQKSVVTYKIISSTATPANQALTAVIKYIDESGNSYEREEQVYVSTGSASSVLSQVKAHFASSQYYVKAGGVAQVTATVVNQSKSDLKNVKIELSGENGVKFLSNYIDLVDEIKAGQSKTFNYKVSVAEGSEGNTYPLYINVKPQRGEDDLGVMAVTGLTVPKTGESSGSKPKIIIADYDYGAEYVLAGKTFPLTISFKNTSTSMGVRNLKATFTSTDNVFVPVDSSNALFIQSIAPGAVVSQTVMVKTKNDAEPKTYSLEFKIAYEDQNGNAYDEKDNPYEETESITINLKQENRLEIAELPIPEMVNVGEPLRFDISFFNMGKSTMYNMLVKIEGDFMTQDNMQFFGTFEPGKSEYFSGTIIAEQEGDLAGKLIFEYEDANGEKETVEREISLMAMPAEDSTDDEFPTDMIDENNNGIPDNMEGDMEQPSQGLPLPWILGGAGTLLAVVAAVILRKRHKNKQAALLEAMDEDE